MKTADPHLLHAQHSQRHYTLDWNVTSAAVKLQIVCKCLRHYKRTIRTKLAAT